MDSQYKYASDEEEGMSSFDIEKTKKKESMNKGMVSDWSDKP